VGRFPRSSKHRIAGFDLAALRSNRLLAVLFGNIESLRSSSVVSPFSAESCKLNAGIRVQTDGHGSDIFSLCFYKVDLSHSKRKGHFSPIRQGHNSQFSLIIWAIVSASASSARPIYYTEAAQDLALQGA
jgi:hypothetical protein